MTDKENVVEATAEPCRLPGRPETFRWSLRVGGLVECDGYEEGHPAAGPRPGPAPAGPLTTPRERGGADIKVSP